MKKLLILLLLSVGVFGQDTLVTDKGKYLLNDAYYSADTTFMFAASITKVLRAERRPQTQDDNDGGNGDVSKVRKRFETEPADVFSDAFADNNGKWAAKGINLTVGKSNSAYFLGARGWRDVVSAPTNGLTGYDYNPIIIEKGRLPWEFGDFVQSESPHPNLPPAGEGTYQGYAVGPDYEVDYSTRLYEFDVKFPEFQLPNGKIVALDVETERSSDGMLTRGVSFAKNTTDISRQVVFVPDDWLHQIGCPKAYSVPASVFQKWLRETPAEVILNAFQRRVSRYKDYGYIMLNWEAVMFHVPDDQRYKFSGLFRWWAAQGYHAKISAWMQAGVTTSRAKLEGDFNLSDYEGVYNFSGSERKFRRNYGSFGGQPDYAQHFDVSLIGGYQNFPTNDGIIHHYLLEYFANKALFPETKALASIWHDQEFLSGWKLTPTQLPGTDFFFYNKPAAFYQTMWNWGVWCPAVGDGFHLWSDDVEWSDNPNDGVYSAKKYDGSPAPVTPGKMYARTNLKTVDWLQRGVWEISQHKDIIDAPTEWVFPVDPAISYGKKELLMAYKLSADGSEALVLALDMFSGEGVNPHNPTLTFPRREGTKTIEFETHGTWTRVLRIKL